ncbi:MAG: TonB-dependent receptor [Pseudoxanthomonas sp.]
MTTQWGSRNLRRTALGVALSMCIAGAAMAQQSGGLRITISGTDGQPLAGATVVASSPDSLISKTGSTDANGRVTLVGLDPATNYTVKVTAQGYADYSASNVAVVSGQNLTVGYALGGGGSATNLDAIVVTGAGLAAIDTTSATVSTVLTLNELEALPTTRSYQNYLQLVPGVKPGGNPSSKSGINSSVTGTTSSSTDNIYILDGVDVTDPVTGTFGANINSEIIQEQQVITGGVPAEFAGGSGLISKVITKSGSNEWHGSLNYYMQNDSLVSDNKHQANSVFSTYDTAFTLGGPIIKDRLWFFASYQKKYREDEVGYPAADARYGQVQRTVEREDEYAFGKLTWQITDNDRLTASFFNDPVTISGSATTSTRNYRDSATEQGGDKYKMEYSHDWQNVSLNLYGFKHESDLNTLAADQSVRSTVVYQTRNAANYTYEDINKGGAGANTLRERNREEFGASLEWFLDTKHGSHTIKLGATSGETESLVNGQVPGGATYTSLNNDYAGATYAQLTQTYHATLRPNGYSSAVFSNDDRARVINGIGNNAALIGALDLNGNGALEVDEISAITFSNTSGNPYGDINAYRSLRTIDGPNLLKSKGKTFFIQDTWTIDQFTVNAGLRAEEWSHYASTGAKLFTFDWKIAPRLSVAYDLFGDGRSKIFGFAGRYYDPIRNDMTAFAGSLSGAVNEEQININGNWITYRTRGGAQVLDSIFAPSTKTPYTDEFMIGFESNIGQNYGFTATITKRDTNNIFEDYDLAVYSDPNGDGADGVAYPGSKLYLPYSYFGLSDAQIAAVQAHEINYVLGTLHGGKREYLGYELTLRKYKSDNWSGQISYTYNDAHGNSLSDGNAGVQGDFIYLDPSAPNTWGKLPGNIEHLFKAWGTYEFPFGLELSGVFNWNSGLIYTPVSYLYGYVAGPRDDPYEWDGIESEWLSAGYTGSGKQPSYYTFDVRAKYTKQLPFGKLEFFVDIFNVLDKQSATNIQTDLGGTTDYPYGSATGWNSPRRFYVGARYSF